MGWLQRPPLVAACMRSSILHSWQPHCGGLQLQQRVVPFNEVRNLSPEAFVATLAEHLQACLPRCSQLPVVPSAAGSLPDTSTHG